MDYREPRRLAGSSAILEEVSLQMRKILALAFVTVLAVSAFGLAGCSKQESTESSTSTETQPMSQPADTTGGMDTTAHHDSM